MLSLLLRHYFRHSGRKVFWLGAWAQELDDVGRDDPWENLAQVVRRKYPALSEQKKQDIFTSNSVIVLGEAQGTYGDTTFWNHIVKSIRGGIGYKIKLSLFCSYGNPSTGMPYNTRDHKTPVDFSAV